MARQASEVEVTRQVLASAVVERRPEALARALRSLAPVDAARVLDSLAPTELGAVVTLLGEGQLAGLLENMAATDAAALVLKLGRAQAADVLERMAPDDAADVVEELDPAQAEAILVAMEAPEAAEVRLLLAYPPQSAAGLMTQEVVTISPQVSAEEALAAIRRVAREVETIYYVYVTDEDERLLGVLSLRQLVLAPPETPTGELAHRDLLTVRADADQEVAARLLADHGLLAIPVVDERERLLGIVTADDAADVLEEEATEDIERLGGSEPLERPYLRTSVGTLVWKRVRWLLALFVAEAYTGSVLRHYEDTLAAAVSLAFFIPLLIGTGGNTGSQITTTLTRALAVGDVRFEDLVRVLRKELAAAVVLGAVMALATVLRAWTLDVEVQIGVIVAITAASIVVWSAAVAAVLPLVLRRFRIDPAVVSAPLITTVVDGTGLIIYFSVANWILGL
jgi:magnesium transporter